ncbi:FMN-binding negative transcriptional regulator [Aestuariirhabdus sp. LZHN29]|uniref:FMN-binding negative transcriptional regulator n=1 Tax=Aestuariirhabdus sp. LZHN29 TaxID=3417462 RepID=UPI003CFA497E
MYVPKHFAVTDRDELHRFIDANGFGQLISNAGGRLFSTHIPFLLSADNSKLLGHLAKQNPQLEEVDGQEVLVTLQGAHDYISPAWYASPGVPTWNYQAVHVYGTCKIIDDADAVQTIVNALTHRYESEYENPWQPQYKASMLGAIAGIEITIGELQGKYKLSQNRSAKDRQQVVEQLTLNGSTQLAAAMGRSEK